MRFGTMALAALALTAITAAPAHAAETIEVVSGPAGTRLVTVAAADPIGQSFTSITDTITSVGFQFATLNGTAANTPLTLSIFAGETLSGTALFSSAFNLPGTIANRTPQWVDIAIPSLAVTQGQLYSLVLTATSNRAALAVGPDFNVATNQFSGGDAYGAGKLLTNWSGIYANCRGAGNNCDTNFRVTGDLAAAPAVPEPSTWAMLIMGFGLLGGVLRRSQQRRRPAMA